MSDTYKENENAGADEIYDTSAAKMSSRSTRSPEDDGKIYGTDEDDVIDGGIGNDTIRGYGGNDTLIGGVGDDDLEGDDGDDTLIDGSGADRFELVLDGSRDRVTDFSVSQGDKIRIDTANGTEDSYQDLGLAISGNNNITHLEYHGKTVMTLTGISVSDVILGSFDTYFDVV